MATLASYGGFSVGEKIKYFFGSRAGKVATISRINSHPLSEQSPPQPDYSTPKYQ